MPAGKISKLLVKVKAKFSKILFILVTISMLSSYRIYLFLLQVTIELIKLLDKLPLEVYKNAFLNLALPVIVLSEPGPVEKTVIK